MAVDFTVELAKQLGFLDRSCKAFDVGHFDEAIRVATALRILFHQTRTSTSLVSHLGADGVHLLSTSLDIAAKQKDPWLRGTTLEKFNGMGQYVPGANPPYRPKLGNGYSQRLVLVSNWWSEIVFALDAETVLARKDVVLAAADKHGGAHVDARLTPEYERLISSHDLGSVQLEGGALVPLEGHHFVALRQMGHEILNSSELTCLAH
jgi:hypothetical protein